MSTSGGQIKFIMAPDADRLRAELRRTREQLSKIKEEMKNLRAETRRTGQDSVSMFGNMVRGINRIAQAYIGSRGVLFAIEQVTEATRRYLALQEQGARAAGEIGQAQLQLRGLTADFTPKQRDQMISMIRGMIGAGKDIQLWKPSEVYTFAREFISGTEGTFRHRMPALRSALEAIDAFANEKEPAANMILSGQAIAKLFSYDPEVTTAENARLLKMGIAAAPLTLSQTRLTDASGMRYFERAVGAMELLGKADERAKESREKFRADYEEIRFGTAAFAAIGQATGDVGGPSTSTAFTALASALDRLLPTVEYVNKEGEKIKPMLSAAGRVMTDPIEKFKAVESEGARKITGEYISPEQLRQMLFVGVQEESKFLTGPKQQMMPAIIGMLTPGGAYNKSFYRAYEGFPGLEDMRSARTIEQMIRENREGFTPETAIYAGQLKSEARSQQIVESYFEKGNIRERLFGEQGLIPRTNPWLSGLMKMSFDVADMLGADTSELGEEILHRSFSGAFSRYRAASGPVERQQAQMQMNAIREQLEQLKLVRDAIEQQNRSLQAVGAKAASSGQQEGR